MAKLYHLVSRTPIRHVILSDIVRVAFYTTIIRMLPYTIANVKMLSYDCLGPCMPIAPWPSRKNIQGENDLIPSSDLKKIREK